MNSYRYRFLAKLVLALFLAHICFVFTGISYADCSYYERQVEIQLDDLKDAKRDLKDLEDQGYLPSVRTHTGIAAAGTAAAGGLLGSLFPGVGTVGGIVTGGIAGGISGAISGAASHYNALKDAKKKVEQAQKDYDEAVRKLNECKSGSGSTSS